MEENLTDDMINAEMSIVITRLEDPKMAEEFQLWLLNEGLSRFIELYADVKLYSVEHDEGFIEIKRVL